MLFAFDIHQYSENNRMALSFLGPTFDVLLPIAGVTHYFQFNEEEISILRNIHKEVNDKVMTALLRYVA